MAETLVEKKVCGECGVDVRPQTSFCYNCGKSVTETPDPDPAEEASSIWFGETISNEPEPAAEPEPEPEPAEDSSDAVTEAWEGPLAAEPEPEPEAEAAEEEPEAPEPEAKAAEEEPEKEGAEVPEPENEPAAEDLDPIHHSLPVESGMRSAASIRRKPKTFQRREVEVSWEEYEGRSGLIYVLITLFVVLFTIIVFWMAMNMK